VNASLDVGDEDGNPTTYQHCAYYENLKIARTQEFQVPSKLTRLPYTKLNIETARNRHFNGLESSRHKPVIIRSYNYGPADYDGIPVQPIQLYRDLEPIRVRTLARFILKLRAYVYCFV
jgi:hypothetical protein